jgi:ketosteroid isomerase-like protein
VGPGPLTTPKPDGARLFTLLPDIEFTVRDVLVAGWPWRTRAVAVVDVRLPSVPSYTNTVVQLIELSWGKITRIENHEDTQALAALLAVRAREGEAEAAADPIW